MRLPAAAGALSEGTVWHLCGAHARTWLELVDEPYGNAADHGEWLTPSEWAQGLGVPPGALILSSAHPKVAHVEKHRVQTRRSPCRIAACFKPVEAGDLDRAWEAACGACAWPAPQERWLSASAGNWAVVYESRLCRLLGARAPEAYQAWAALGAEGPRIQYFVFEHAPALLEEANQRQAAHLNTPEALAKRHAITRAKEREGVPDGSKRCIR